MNGVVSGGCGGDGEWARDEAAPAPPVSIRRPRAQRYSTHCACDVSTKFKLRIRTSVFKTLFFLFCGASVFDRAFSDWRLPYGHAVAMVIGNFR